VRRVRAYTSPRMYTLTPPRQEGTAIVRKGRKLGYADFGSPTGRTFVWFHGTPGGRRQIPEDARVLAEKSDLRIIGIDRPGTGLSTGNLCENIVDLTPDVAMLMDHLGVDRFSVIGLSGGGPYALASAYAMPDRVVVAGILGGVIPNVGEESRPGGVVGGLSGLRPVLPWISPALARAFQVILPGLSPVGTQALDLFAHFSPEGDRIVFARPEVKAMFIDDLVGSGRRGIAGPFNDLALFLRPWGFSVRDITVPVRWWHGDADNWVPLAHAEYLVPMIPDAELYIRPGESHLGGLGAAEEVISVLLNHWDAPTLA
jgi:pimeloyl-ACP methyl ester carboxylesterase